MSGPDPAALAFALAGLDRVQRDRPSLLGPEVCSAELVAVWSPPRQEYEVRLAAYGTVAGPAARARTWTGYGATLPAALVHLWAGELGLWRWTDPEGWTAALYPEGRPRATNPGPLAGQTLGRGDG